MTVENIQNKMPPLQMGSTTQYPFTFAVLLQDPTEEEALKAIKARVLLADGSEVELVYETDYTVELNTNRIGGTLTVNDIRTDEDYLTIYRLYEQTQEVDYRDFNSAPAETFEQCFDKLTMLSQQQQEQIDRSIKLPLYSSATNLTLPIPDAGKTLKWNEEETGLINSDVSIDEIDDFVKSANESAEIAVEKAEEIQGKLDEALEVADTIKDIEIIATLEIGDIGIAPLGIDESLGKRRYLNGSILVQEQYPYFTERVKTAVQTYTGLGCTEEEWQTISNMSVGGQCGKFVVDDTAGTIRLPKIIMPIQGLTNLTNLGEIVEAGLPNITGKYGGVSAGVSGAFSGGSLGANTLSSYNANVGSTQFDASLSNPIYSNSNTVQQEQIQYPYFIQVATGSSYQENITNEIELNNPFVLLEGHYFTAPVYNSSWLQSNASFTGSLALHPTAYNALLIEQNPNVEVGTTVDNYTKRGLSVKLDTEAYTDYDFVLNTTSQTFRCPLKINKASGRAVVGNGIALGLTVGTSYTYGLATDGNPARLSAYTTAYGKPIPTSGLSGGVYPDSSKAAGVTTDPTKSGLELADSDVYLYFYVGETVQNANLVNVGRVEEIVANCITLNDCPSYVTETYQNGSSWYRVYSDGWCEQGGAVDNNGRTQIALLKNFIDTNYEVMGSCFTKNSSSNGCWFCYDTKTTSSFYVRFSYDNGNSISTNSNYVYIWEAKGKVF